MFNEAINQQLTEIVNVVVVVQFTGVDSLLENIHQEIDWHDNVQRGKELEPVERLLLNTQ